MKLFTEEEVRKAISEAMFYHDTVDAHISKITPIEAIHGLNVSRRKN